MLLMACYKQHGTIHDATLLKATKLHRVWWPLLNLETFSTVEFIYKVSFHKE